MLIGQRNLACVCLNLGQLTSSAIMFKSKYCLIEKKYELWYFRVQLVEIQFLRAQLSHQRFDLDSLAVLYGQVQSIYWQWALVLHTI